ncbi:28S ribosomal protein S26, mitochondrial [Brienomyrus brachyistius]|uniref:28S ribosomal protein S26, mitochondrial n=1 Tax=Brienomyrus brachyistius TaxID=42636 RepID=UPI0020B2E68D|nr:28S ribosomal protein S26, mitochondrial [Brienomyrus brachyistius]
MPWDRNRIKMSTAIMFQVAKCPVQVCRFLSPRGSVLIETVRGRKSRNDQKAKSKQDRVKMPPPIDPVEMVVLKERYTQYQMIMRALRVEFKEQIMRRRYEEEVGSRAEERAKQEAEEHRALMAWNDAENLRLRQLREIRVQKEVEELAMRREEAIGRQEEKRRKILKEKEQEILQLQEEVKTFITLENLEQRIEEALDNPKNYNFAIDKDGRVVKRTVIP